MEAATPEEVVDKAAKETHLAQRQLVLTQWLDWNNASGRKNDVISSLNAIGVDVHFASDLEARQFMNKVYDKLIVSVRAELGADWRPS